MPTPRYMLLLNPWETMPEPEITLRPRYSLHMTLTARETAPNEERISSLKPL
jgi:hypothetical protein